MLKVSQLCGFGVGRLHITTLALFAQSVNQATPSFPAGIIAGDILIFTQWAANSAGGPPSLVTPTGFTSLRSNTIGNLRTNVAYKLAAGTETGALSVMSGTFGRSANILVFRPDRPVASITTMSNVTSGLVNTDPGALTILSGSSTGPKFVLATYTSTAAVSPRVFTQGGVDARQSEYNSNAANTHSLAWKTFKNGEATANIAVDMDDEGDNNEINGFALTLTG